MIRPSYFRAMVYAYLAPEGERESAGACLWFRVQTDHHIRVISELTFTHQLEHDLAQQILARDRALMLANRIGYTVANPECFNFQTKEPKGFTGQTIAITFALCGIALTQGDDNTFNGWQRVRGLFRASPDGSPWLTIDQACEHLIRALTTALSDDTKPNELASYAPALHALRFAAMSQPAPETISDFDDPPPGTPAAVMRELMREGNTGRRFGEAR